MHQRLFLNLVVNQRGNTLEFDGVVITVDEPVDVFCDDIGGFVLRILLLYLTRFQMSNVNHESQNC